jgi:hypothetical protein
MVTFRLIICRTLSVLRRFVGTFCLHLQGGRIRFRWCLTYGRNNPEEYHLLIVRCEVLKTLFWIWFWKTCGSVSMRKKMNGLNVCSSWTLLCSNAITFLLCYVRGCIQHIPDWCRHLYSGYGSAKHWYMVRLPCLVSRCAKFHAAWWTWAVLTHV